MKLLPAGVWGPQGSVYLPLLVFDVLLGGGTGWRYQPVRTEIRGEHRNNPDLAGPLLKRESE